jgi:hypothetical protein
MCGFSPKPQAASAAKNTALSREAPVSFGTIRHSARTLARLT